MLLEHRGEHPQREPSQSEKPPEPEGPSGFSTRELAANVLACQTGTAPTNDWGQPYHVQEWSEPKLGMPLTCESSAKSRTMIFAPR